MPDIEALKLGLKRVEQAAELGGVIPEYGVAELDAEPEHLGLNQVQWITIAQIPEGVCLTAGCFAGHVAIAEGFTVPVMQHGECQGVLNPMTWQTLTFGAVYREGTVANFAARRLGLTDDQADDLFNEINTLDELRRQVAALCGETVRE